MKLYKYTFGEWENYGPANDDADAYERRVGIDPQFHYVPVTIEEVKLEGYEITVSPIEQMAEPTREDMKAELNSRGIAFIIVCLGLVLLFGFKKLNEFQFLGGG